MVIFSMPAIDAAAVLEAAPGARLRSAHTFRARVGGGRWGRKVLAGEGAQQCLATLDKRLYRPRHCRSEVKSVGASIAELHRVDSLYTNAGGVEDMLAGTHIPGESGRATK